MGRVGMMRNLKTTQLTDQEKAYKFCRGINEKDLSWLLNTPGSDGNFRQALARSNKDTLSEALNHFYISKLSRRLIESEIKRIDKYENDHRN